MTTLLFLAEWALRSSILILSGALYFAGARFFPTGSAKQGGLFSCAVRVSNPPGCLSRPNSSVTLEEKISCRI